MLTVTMKGLFFTSVLLLQPMLHIVKLKTGTIIKTKNTKFGNANEVDLALSMSYLQLLFSPSQTETKSHPYGRVVTLEPGFEFRLN